MVILGKRGNGLDTDISLEKIREPLMERELNNLFESIAIFKDAIEDEIKEKGKVDAITFEWIEDEFNSLIQKIPQKIFTEEAIQTIHHAIGTIPEQQVGERLKASLQGKVSSQNVLIEALREVLHGKATRSDEHSMQEKESEGKRKNPVEIRKEFLESASQRLQELAKVANRYELSAKLNEIISEAAHSYVFYRGRINEERAEKDEALKTFNEELTNAGIPAGQRSQYYLEHEWVDPKENKAKHQILLRFDIAQKIGRVTKGRFSPEEISEMQDFILRIRLLKEHLTTMPEREIIDLTQQSGETEEQRARRIAREDAERKKATPSQKEKQGEEITTPEKIRATMYKEARRGVEQYEMFQSEPMEDDARRSLVATLELARNKRANELVDKWIKSNPEKVRERAYGTTTQLPPAEQLKLVLENEGEDYFEKEDPYYRRLVVTAENLRNAKPELRSALLSFSCFDELHKDLDKQLIKNPYDASLLAERDRLVQSEEALYKSVHKKEIPFNNARAQQEALDDLRTGNDLDEFLKGIDTDAALQKRRKDDYHDLLSPREISALEALGYEIKPQKTRRFWLEKFSGIKIFKDGKEVTVNNADIQKQFKEDKKKEFAQKYLQEKVVKEKVESLRNSIAALRNPDEIKKLTEDLERETTAKLFQKMEEIRLKKQEPEVERKYQEVLKDKGESVGKMIEASIMAGEQEKLRKDFDAKDEEFERLFAYYHAPEKYIKNITAQDRDMLRKAKTNPLKWVYTVFMLISQLEQLVQV